MLVLAAEPLTTHCRETDRTTAQGAGLSIAWDGYFKSTGQRMSQDSLDVGLGVFVLGMRAVSGGLSD